MKIDHIKAYQIIDSRGVPTVECELFLDNGSSFTASVPSGKSRGVYEAVEKRDGGNAYGGMGVTTVIHSIEHVISPRLKGLDPDFIVVDEILRELDGTENKKNLGANALLPVSIATTRAQAACENITLYEFMAGACNNSIVGLPMPFFNVINGGVHANNGLSIQEFMIVPSGASYYAQALEGGLTAYHALKNLLIKDGKSIAVGDEGGFAPFVSNEYEVFDYLMKAITIASDIHGYEFKIALDLASSQWYSPQTKLYTYQQKEYDALELVSLYKKWCTDYPIISLEDGLSESDWAGWSSMTQQLDGITYLIGDDLFATNLQRIAYGIEHDIAHGVLIKPNQCGTVTETLQAIILCLEHDRIVQISHRSGETNDAFIADLAVAVKAPFIKAGSPVRGERVAKYNRLLRIEESLMMME